MAGEECHLRVVAISQKPFESRRAPVPARPFSAMPDSVLKTPFGVALQHRPGTPFRLGAPADSIERLGVKVGVACRRASVLESSKRVPPVLPARRANASLTVVGARDRLQISGQA